MIKPALDLSAAAATPLIDITIDGMTTSVPAGTTVMQAAKTVGVDIARLCANDTLKPFGSCRLCVVDIAG